jgi:hypothetical protein
MIHEILPADVDFARGMIHASHSDAEILASLAARGLETSKATRLVDDLRHGRNPSCQLPYPPDALFRSSTRGSQPAVVHPPLPPPVPELQPHRRKHHRSHIPWWFVFLALFFLCALGYALFESGRAVSSSTIQDSKHDLPAAPGK